MANQTLHKTLKKKKHPLHTFDSSKHSSSWNNMVANSLCIETIYLVSWDFTLFVGWTNILRHRTHADFKKTNLLLFLNGRHTLDDFLFFFSCIVKNILLNVLLIKFVSISMKITKLNFYLLWFLS